MVPKWLVTGRTIMVLKNNETAQAKNCHPVTFQNVAYKLLTGIINSFMVDHCTASNIITPKQVGCKQRSRGCTDQLFINKIILDKTKHHHHNWIWFDNREYLILSHEFLKAFELAHVLINIIHTIKGLRFSKYMGYKITPKFHKTDVIKYLTGVRQEDYLVLILFILNVKPQSFLSNKLPGHTAGPPGKQK